MVRIEILPSELVVMSSFDVEVALGIVNLVQPEVDGEGRVQLGDGLLRDFS